MGVLIKGYRGIMLTNSHMEPAMLFWVSGVEGKSSNQYKNPYAGTTYYQDPFLHPYLLLTTTTRNVLLGRWFKGGGRNFQKCNATVVTIKTLSVELLAIRILVSCRISRV